MTEMLSAAGIGVGLALLIVRRLAVWHVHHQRTRRLHKRFEAKLVRSPR